MAAAKLKTTPTITLELSLLEAKYLKLLTQNSLDSSLEETREDRDSRQAIFITLQAILVTT